MVAKSRSINGSVALLRPRYRRLSVDLLDFDPDNPRFGGAAEDCSQDQIQPLLEKSPHYARELVPSLVENGFIAYEPLVVREEGERFFVIEGNRRLAAIRYILANRDRFPPAAVQRLDKIPALDCSSLNS